MTKAEIIEIYGINKYEEYKEHIKLKCKERYKNEPEFRSHHNRIMKTYLNNEFNSNGKTKHSIRGMSYHILFKQRQHVNIKGYEIHHAFGYDDPSKFIYIPRSLHKAIHSFLKENNINADTDHYKYISTMINECTEYTYISA